MCAIESESGWDPHNNMFKSEESGLRENKLIIINK
jgi:hypothetical protein